MPSEPLPCDRNEFYFKDLELEKGGGSHVVGRGGGVGGEFCSTSRWWESCHGFRDFPRASPGQPLPGHCRYDERYSQLYAEESSGHGCTPSRSGERFWPEDEIFWSSSGRCDVGGRGNSSAGSWGSGRRSTNIGGCSRQHNVSPMSPQRFVVVPITQASPTSSSPIPLKELHETSDRDAFAGAGIGHSNDRDQSLGSMDWKPTRPSSLPSSKEARSDYEETGLESSVILSKQSPAGFLVTSPLPSDDGAPRKKPRLGWGQGLAKYEKQKVEVYVDVSGQNGSVQSTNSVKDLASDSGPKITALAGSMSPATPTSAICSSSPAVTDEKLSIKGLNVNADRAQNSDSSGFGLQNSSEEISMKLDQLDANSISRLASLLSDLMQPEDAYSGDSSLTKRSTINTLLLLKKDITKELEKTEVEIDLFENELKFLKFDGQKNCQESSFTSQVVSVAQSRAKSAKALKTLSEVPLSNNYVQASSVILGGEQVVGTNLSEEHSTDVEDINHNSSGVVFTDVVQLACLERQNPYSSYLQSYPCPANNNYDQQQLPDAESLKQPSIGMPTDICSHELDYCLDQRTTGKADDELIAYIMASNNDAAKRASQEFDQAMPSDLSQFNLWESNNFLQCCNINMLIRGKLGMNKFLLKFKERVLAIKFRALHHLWRENLHLASMRKYQPKSNKRLEANSCSLPTVLQKQHSSIRSIFALSGNLTLVPTTEILNFTSELLSDSQIRLYRNNVKMPSQIIDEKERRYSRFNSNNGLIEDPPAFERERVMMNPWMQEEVVLFLEMLATFGKNFKKISSFLSHKTTADCIAFYYKNLKSENFTEVKRQLKHRKQCQSLRSNMYLITSGARWNSSLDLLGTSSMIMAQSNGNTKNNQKHSGRSGYHDKGISYWSNGSIKKTSVEISGDERETAAADVLAGIYGAFSSEAMISCGSSSIDPPERVHYATMDERINTIDEEYTCSNEGSGELESADWTDEEKSMFIRALNMYGKDFVKVSHFIRTRSRDQCKIFFSKARKCLGLDEIHTGSASSGTPLSDANGGRSNIDEVCAAEIDSAICSRQPCSKMDVDFTKSTFKTCREVSFHASSTTPLQADTDRSCEQQEFTGSITVEVTDKFDKQSPVNEDNLVSDGEDSKYGKDQGKIGSYGLRCNEPEHVHGAADSCVEAETKNLGTDFMLCGGKPFKLNNEDKLNSQITAGVPQTASSGSFSVDELKSEVGLKEFSVLPGPALENISQVKLEDGANVGNSYFVPTSHSKEHHHKVIELKNNDFPSLVFSTNFQYQVPHKSLKCLQRKHQTKLVKPEPALTSQLNYVLPDSSTICFDEPNQSSSQAILNLQVQGSKWRLESVGRNICQQYLLKTPLSSQIEIPLDTLWGHPLQSLNQKQSELKIERKMIDEKSALESHLKADTATHSNCFVVPGLNNVKCGGVGLLNSRPEIPLPPKNEDKSGTHLTEDKSDSLLTRHSQGNPCTEFEHQSQRIGDVKLFGQILTHPSSQKPCPSQQGDLIPPSPIQNASVTTSSSNSWKDASIFAPKLESNALLHQPGELPRRSSGLWDGSSNQTGLSSFTESDIILAERESVTGMPFCMVKDAIVNSNILCADYHLQAHLQPLSADKRLPETFPELQKRNSFDMASGFQRQGRMVHPDRNINGGTGLSDPVAALHMHYSGRRTKNLAHNLEA